jgi:hypothetical protein
MIIIVVKQVNQEKLFPIINCFEVLEKTINVYTLRWQKKVGLTCRPWANNTP